MRDIFRQTATLDDDSVAPLGEARPQAAVDADAAAEPEQAAGDEPTPAPTAEPPPAPTTPPATAKSATPAPTPPPPAATKPAPATPAPPTAPNPKLMTGPPVPADWRDKDALATVTGTLTFDAPRIGPFTPATRDAVRKAVDATVGSEGKGRRGVVERGGLWACRRRPSTPSCRPASIDIRRIDQAGPATPVGTADSSKDRMPVTVVFDVPMRALTPALQRMQSASDNAELAGGLRARGLYDVSDARFTKYGLAWGDQAVEEKKGAAAAPARAPAPAPAPAVVELPPLPTLPATPQPVPSPKPTSPPMPGATGGAPPPPLVLALDLAGSGAADLTDSRTAAVKNAVAAALGVNASQVEVGAGGGSGRRLLADAPPAGGDGSRRGLRQAAPSAPPAWTQRVTVTISPAPDQGASVRAAADRLADSKPTGGGSLFEALKREGWPELTAAGVAKPAAVVDGDGGGVKLSVGAVVGIAAGAAAGLVLALVAAALAARRCARPPPPVVGAAAGAPKQPAPLGAPMQSVDLGSAAPARRGLFGRTRPPSPDRPAPPITDGVAGAKRDMASIAAAGVTSLRKLASGAGKSGGRAAPAFARPPRPVGALPDPLDDVEDAVADLALRGTPFAGRYALDAVLARGAATLDVGARQIAPPKKPVVARFFLCADDFRHEGALAARLPPRDATPAVLDAWPAGGAPGAGSLPACVVTEASDYSLADWPRKRSRTPDEVQRRAVLAMVAKAVSTLHANNVVHGGLCPDAVLWFSAANAMKLTSLGAWAPAGARAAPHPDPRYAAPEAAAAVAAGAVTVSASPAGDAWALGMLAFWIFTDAPLLPNATTNAAAAAALGSAGPLPWEARPATLAKLPPAVAAVVAALLARDPADRMTADGVLASPLFRGGRRPRSALS